MGDTYQLTQIVTLSRTEGRCNAINPFQSPEVAPLSFAVLTIMVRAAAVLIWRLECARFP